MSNNKSGMHCRRLYCFICKVLSSVLQYAIKFYQLFVSPVIPPSCRFYPTCSEYCLIAIRKHGTFRGSMMCLSRIGRCNPWYSGSKGCCVYDPVDETKDE